MEIKKIFLLLIGLAVVVTFFGCETDENGVPDPDPAMDEGVFVGYSEESRGFTRAEVLVQNGDIERVNLEEYDNRGLKKDVDFEYDVESWAETRDDYPEEYESITEMLETLEDRFEEENSADIDGISGATGTYEQAKEAVDMALLKANGETGPFDGSFMAMSDDDARGWGIAIVEVAGGDIVNVELEEAAKDEEYGLKRDAELKGEDYDWDEFHEAKEELPKRFLEANSPDIDVYSGATGSSEDWMQAVARALSTAGVYERLEGASEENRGFTKVDMVINEDEFVDVALTEFDDTGQRKGVDYEYLDEGRMERWGENIEEADELFQEYESIPAMLIELEDRFLEANSSDIDIISGATSTSNQAIEAVDYAFKEEPIDGTFMGVSSVYPNDTWGIALVTFDGGNIQEVKLEEAFFNEEGEAEIKEEDYDWDEFQEAKEELPDRFVEENSSEVDVYTGATGSSERWMDAVRDAMKNAKIRRF